MARTDAGARSDATGAEAVQLHGRQRSVALGADFQFLQCRGTITDGHMFFASIEHEADRCMRFP